MSTDGFLKGLARRLGTGCALATLVAALCGGAWADDGAAVLPAAAAPADVLGQDADVVPPADVLGQDADVVPPHVDVLDRNADGIPHGDAVVQGNGDVVHEEGPVVQELGTGDYRIYVVDHGGTWSMHAQDVPAQTLFDAWREGGGPVVTSKILLDFPFTLSLHRAAPERIIDRILDGWGYTLHYDAAGRIERVRVYSPQPMRTYKTPRLVETLSTWRLAETAPADQAPQAPTPGAASLPGQ